MTMSEMGPASFVSFGAGGGFRTDARFAPLGEAPPPPAPMPEPEPADPVALAFAEGFNAGAAEAQAAAARQAQIDAEARERLGLSFARLDKELADELRLRLRDTVAALCEAAIAPLALDKDMLLSRIEKAVSMLARADDDRVIRLHPDDMAMISDRLLAEWEVQPDPSLERGALRVETSNGGVEDGPEHWRRAIAEALHQC